MNCFQMKSSLVCASLKLHIFHILHVLPVFDGQIRLYLAKKDYFLYLLFRATTEKFGEENVRISNNLFCLCLLLSSKFLKKENFGN